MNVGINKLVEVHAFSHDHLQATSLLGRTPWETIDPIQTVFIKGGVCSSKSLPRSMSLRPTV